jgi:cytidine deaminase
MIMDNIEKELYQAAVELVKVRYPSDWGGAAAVRTESGKILTSIAPDIKNDALSLCMEVGAYLEAHKLNERVTHSLCLCRESENDEFLILSPCGVCQERLVYWGGDVKAAITTPDNALVFKTIRELMPHHWSLVNGKLL